MEKPTAEAILLLMFEARGKLDKAVAIAMTTEKGEDFIKFRSTIGGIMGSIFLDVTSPILDQYPELTPDYLKSST